MKSWLNLLKDGAAFPAKRFFKHRGVYVYKDDPPEICPVCESTACRYHAHGSFLRWLKTYIEGRIKRIRIRKPRYMCLMCGHTFSLHPPEGIPYKPTCNLLIVIFLWSYLTSSMGMHNCLPGELSEEVSVRTVTRHLKSAKAIALETQQFIREVLIEKLEPRPVEELFSGGLDPPESLLQRQAKEPKKVSTLWRALYMIHQGAKALSIDPRTLLAWANQKSRQKNRGFLI